jgi:hypothetical protein
MLRPVLRVLHVGEDKDTDIDFTSDIDLASDPDCADIAIIDTLSDYSKLPADLFEADAEIT